ncbi:MAG: hypothetical protein PHY90_07100 [Desulfitobacteriaceae bacterium]|nr:hypothetical protein [Desulfitobacteriaceae bacterium]
MQEKGSGLGLVIVKKTGSNVERQDRCRKPRSDLGEPVNIDLNEADEYAATVEDEVADEDEAMECNPDEEEPIDEEENDGEVVEVDKSELEAVIETAYELEEADYTAETWRSIRGGLQ